MSSLIIFAIVYAIVFGAGIWYLLSLVRKGPQPHEPAPDTERRRQDAGAAAVGRRCRQTCEEAAS